MQEDRTGHEEEKRNVFSRRKIRHIFFVYVLI